MTAGTDGGSAAVNGIIEPEAVAQEVVTTMDNGKFLVLPHPEVAQYFRNKGQDYERWIGGMQKMYALHAAE